MFGKHHTKEAKRKIALGVSKKLKGRIFTEEHKRNLSRGRSGIPSFSKGIGHRQRFINLYGKKLGNKRYEEFIKKIKKSHIDKSKGEKNPMFGKSIYSIWLEKNGKKFANKRLKEYKENMSNSLREKKHKMKLFKCPHCGLEGKGGNMTRYHFNNCKFK